MSGKEQELERRLKQLVQHLAKCKKKAKDNNQWFIAGFDALKEPNDEAQQGPMVNKLFELVEDNKRYLKGK